MKKCCNLFVLVLIMLILSGTFVIGLNTGTATSNEKIIYWQQVAPVNQEAAIANGTLAACVSWEPYVSGSLEAGTANVIAWSGDIWPNHPCCVQAVSTSFAQNNPDAAARLLRADIEANIWLNDALSHPNSANYTLLLNMGAQLSVRNTTVVNASLAHIKYKTAISAQDESWFVNFTTDFQNLGLYTTNITEKGYTNATDYINHLVDNSFVTAAMAVQPSDHIVANVSLGYLTGDLHQFARVIASNATVGGGQSLFEKYGVKVSTPNPAGYANGGAVMDAFKADTIDMGYLGASSVLLKVINAGVSVKIVGLVNSDGSAIVAANSITDFSQLQGKIVGTPGPGSIQHLLFLAFCNQNGFNLMLAGTGTQSTPTSPQNLSAIPGNGNVKLNWTAPSNNGGAAIDYYIIYQNGLDVQHVSGTSRTITGLTNGLTYSFIVSAHNSAGIGPQTSIVSATPNPTTTVPSAPYGLQATPGNGQISLTWNDPTDYGGLAITSYQIYRSTAGGTWTEVGTAYSTSYSDSGLTNGQKYYYYVTAKNSVGEGASSVGVQVTPIGSSQQPVVLSPPIDVTATGGNGQVVISWHDSVTGSPTSYEVFRGTYSGDMQVLYGSLEHGTYGNSYTDTTAEAGQTYYYYVVAVSGDSSSGVVLSSPSETVSAIAQSIIPPNYNTGQSNNNNSSLAIVALIVVIAVVAVIGVIFIRRRKMKRIPPKSQLPKSMGVESQMVEKEE